MNGAVEGQVKLEGPESFYLLQDTLACLASEEIKLASLKSKAEEDPDAITPEAKNDMAIKKTIISQVGVGEEVTKNISYFQKNAQ